jgi:diadenosine tetraphosphate (Ap4A) HIT family hydrolase
VSRPTALSTCEACTGRWPDPANRIGELDESVAYLHNDQFFPGWTVLVLRRHATELFELGPTERAHPIEEVSEVAEILAAVFAARKINYALFGNQLPHLHWHVVPRLASDPAPRAAVFAVEHRPVRLSPVERRDRIARIRSRFGR